MSTRSSCKRRPSPHLRVCSQDGEKRTRRSRPFHFSGSEFASARTGGRIIQAKRTKNVVPFETVSALVGVVEHKRAAKGILVTTSWFGRASEAFANEHGRLELLDGANLVHLFKEHMDLDVIPGPVPPKRRPK